MTNTISVKSDDLNEFVGQVSDAQSVEALSAKLAPPVRSKLMSTSKLSPGSSRLARTKSDLILKKLRGCKGVTFNELAAATNWQAHSVRGFLSGTVRRKLDLTLTNEVGKDGKQRYCIHDVEKAR